MFVFFFPQRSLFLIECPCWNVVFSASVLSLWLNALSNFSFLLCLIIVFNHFLLLAARIFCPTLEQLHLFFFIFFFILQNIHFWWIGNIYFLDSHTLHYPPREQLFPSIHLFLSFWGLSSRGVPRTTMCTEFR